MNLHENTKLFRQLIETCALQKGIPAPFIEKDYWLTTVLKKLSESSYCNRFVFKGGTSLSKAYALIERFSEDVDLALLADGLTGNQIKSRIDKISKEITKHLTETHIEAISKKWSRFRRTAHEYPSVTPFLDGSQMLTVLVIELNAFGHPHPYQESNITSMIGDFLYSQKRSDLLIEYGMLPFCIQVLKPERTLSEKILALARASYNPDPITQLQHKIRHAYDLHILMATAQLQQFLATDLLFETLKQVQEDDDASREFQGEWNKQPLADALIFSDTDSLWKDLAKTYNGTFSSLVYGYLPPIQKVRESIRSLKIRLQAFDSITQPG